MATVYFITHPEVVIDPSVAVPQWPLSARGVRRMVNVTGQPWISGVRAVFTSAERKALEAARILADHLLLVPIIIEDLGENDRSATGYLPKAEFEITADQFFGCPDESVRGWERAIDAQSRIVRAMERAIAMAPPHADLAIISHGGVGALLLCHLKGVPISRTEDQPAGGGGNLYSFDSTSHRLLSGWRSIDDE